MLRKTDIQRLRRGWRKNKLLRQFAQIMKKIYYRQSQNYAELVIMTRRRSRIVRYPGDVFLRLAIHQPYWKWWGHAEDVTLASLRGSWCQNCVMRHHFEESRCQNYVSQCQFEDFNGVKAMWHGIVYFLIWCQSLSCGIILSTCDVRTIKQDVILRTFVTSTLCEWCHFEDSWCRKFVKLYHCYLWAVKTMIASIRGLVTSKLCVLTPYRVPLMSKLCDLTLSWELPTSKLCIRCFPLVLWLGFGQQQTLNYNIQRE